MTLNVTKMNVTGEDFNEHTSNVTLVELRGEDENEVLMYDDGGMGLVAETAWTVLYSVMIIVAIAGNAIVMWIVTGISLKK